VLRDTTTWLGLFLELNSDGSDVLSGTGAKYTCSGMFRRPRESHSMTIWCLGRSLHCPVLSVKGQKSKLPWNMVKRSWRQPSVKTCDDVCTTGEACLTKTSTERTTESRRQSYRRPGGELTAIGKKSSYPSDWQTALKQDCAGLQPTVWEYFVTLLKPLIWQKVCRCVYYFGWFSWRDTVV